MARMKGIVVPVVGEVLIIALLNIVVNGIWIIDHCGGCCHIGDMSLWRHCGAIVGSLLLLSHWRHCGAIVGDCIQYCVRLAVILLVG